MTCISGKHVLQCKEVYFEFENKNKTLKNFFFFNQTNPTCHRGGEDNKTIIFPPYLNLKNPHLFMTKYFITFLTQKAMNLAKEMFGFCKVPVLPTICFLYLACNREIPIPGWYLTTGWTDDPTGTGVTAHNKRWNWLIGCIQMFHNSI